MNTLQASRRGFLSNLAILTAGVALGNNASGIFPGDSVLPDLEALWKSFCNQQSGKYYSGTLENKKEIIACKGHQHTEGQPVYFSKENIIAQPVWIYWAGNRNIASDVVINFYLQEGRVVSMNRFELKAFAQTQDLPQDNNRLKYFFKLDDSGSRLYVARTTIGTNNTTFTQFSAVKTQEAFV